MSTERKPFGAHAGRAWSGTAIEDACLCPQEPCGLVDPGLADPDCPHHPLVRSKSFRQGHSAKDCPGTRIGQLIEQSSLGGADARALRESVPVEVAQEVLRRANAKSSDSLGAVTPLPAAEGGRPGGDGSGPLAAPRRDVPDEEAVAVRRRYDALFQIADHPCSNGDAAFSCPDLPIGWAEWCSYCIAFDALNPSSSPAGSGPGGEAAPSAAERSSRDAAEGASNFP
ncbi:hypothetical protein [Nocardia sp. NPDC004260]